MEREAHDAAEAGPLRGRALSRRAWLGSAASAAGAILLTGKGASGAVGSPMAALREAGDRVLPEVAALAFDVFGTVVDWRGSIVREGERLAVERGWRIDWGAFADAWRAGYSPAMGRVASGELPWMTIDEIHRRILDDLLPRFGLEGMSEADRDALNRVWHRLLPWPDTVLGLHRLRSRYIVVTLSNGNVSLLVNMARHAGLPWDAVLSAELAGRYKPDPEAYLLASRLLDLPPERILMVAAHKSDLRGAARAGLRTAWVMRPLERGPDRPFDATPDPEFDLSATDFLDLARQLGA